MSVLLVAAKRDLIEGRIALLQEAGLNAQIIDVDAFALHNAFERSYPNAQNGLVALVNIGHETTNVNLLEDGAPRLVQNLPFGSRRLREALQRERGMSADKAEEVIQGEDGSVDLRSFVVERVDELAVGVERALAFLTAHSGNQDLDRVYLSGGASRVPGLAEALGERLGVRTEVANPLERVAIRPEVTQAVAIDEVAPMLMLSVGLALRRPA
jgi:type IV pilus assembly protein PilM